MQNNDISEDILKEMKQQTEILKEIKETQYLIKSELLRKLEMRKNSHLNLRNWYAINGAHGNC